MKIKLLTSIIGLLSESGRLISDVLEITNSLDIEGLLMTINIEKVFDSINHSFLMCVLKKFGFGNEFRKWMQILKKARNRVLSVVVKQHRSFS